MANRADWEVKYGSLSPQYISAEQDYIKRVRGLADRLGMSYGDVESGISSGNIAQIFKEIVAKGNRPRLIPAAYDTTRVESLAQRLKSPALRRILQETRRAIGSSSDNANVNALNRRRALEGLGQGLENISAGARTSAAQMYAPEYAAEQDASVQNYLAALEDYRLGLKTELESLYNLKPPQKPVYTESFIGSRSSPFSTAGSYNVRTATAPTSRTVGPGVNYRDPFQPYSLASQTYVPNIAGYGGQTYAANVSNSGSSLLDDIKKITGGY